MTETSRRAALADIREFLFRAGALAVLLVLLFGVVFGLALRPDYTMHPHSRPVYLLLFCRFPRGYTAGGVVVLDKEGGRYTGLVAARGGDTMEVTAANSLVINGSVVAEPDIYGPTPPYEDGPAYPLTLAEGEYFILCDARAGARDSRWFGPVQAGEIQGRVIAIMRRNGI